VRRASLVVGRWSLVVGKTESAVRGSAEVSAMTAKDGEGRMNLSLSREEDWILRAMETWNHHVPEEVSIRMLNQWWFASQQWLSQAGGNEAFVLFERALERAYIQRGVPLPPRGRSFDELDRLWTEMYSVPNSWTKQELEQEWSKNQKELAKDPTDWDALTTQATIKRQYGRRGLTPPAGTWKDLTNDERPTTNDR
jgi:hypothetical protein